MLGLVAWLSAVGLIATEIELTQRESRRQLERRFAIRADSAAQFIEVYAQEVLERERAQALAQLNRSDVTRAALRQRRRRRRLSGCRACCDSAWAASSRSLPAKPALIGQLVGQRYAHLRSALAGDARGLRQLSLALADGAPIVAFAVPFPTARQARVQRRLQCQADSARRVSAECELDQAERRGSRSILTAPSSRRAAVTALARVPAPARGQPARRTTAVSFKGEPFRVAVRARRRDTVAARGDVPEARLYAAAVRRRSLDPLGRTGALRARLGRSSRCWCPGC